MLVNFRSAAGIVAIWLAVVAGVAATAWVVIDRAGRAVTGTQVSALPVPGGTATPGTTATPTAATPTSPTHGATSTPSTTSSAGGPSTTPAAPAPRDRSITVTGGQVSMRCTGAVAAIRSAQPENGWRVEVGQAGPQEVEVEFGNGDGGDESRTKVKGVCSAGGPVFTVENES